MGYGAVGLTKSGSGAVPRAGLSYGYCYDNKPTDMPEPECIILNHGANDRLGEVEIYLKKYSELLDVVFEKHPKSEVFILGAFCGWCHEELGVFVENYNKRTGRNVRYINTYGWIPVEPLHPAREGHRIVADNLIKELRKYNIFSHNI